MPLKPFNEGYFFWLSTGGISVISENRDFRLTNFSKQFKYNWFKIT